MAKLLTLEELEAQAPATTAPADSAPQLLTPEELVQSAPISEGQEAGIWGTLKSFLPRSGRFGALGLAADAAPDALATAQRGAAYFNRDPAGRAAALEHYGLPPSGGGVQDFTAEMLAETPTMMGAGAGAALGAPFVPPLGMAFGAFAGAFLPDLARSLGGYWNTGQLTPDVIPGAVGQATQTGLWETAAAGAGPAIAGAMQRGMQALRRPGPPTVAPMGPGSWGFTGPPVEGALTPGTLPGTPGRVADVNPVTGAPYVRGLRGTVESINRPEAMARADASLAVEEATGIPYPMTPGELSGDPSIVDRETMMQLFPGSAPQMDSYIRQRSLAAQDIMQSTAEGMSPGRNVTPDEAWTGLGQAADKSVKNVRRERKEATQGLYNQALNKAPRVNVEPILKELVAKLPNEPEGQTRTVIEYAIDNLQNNVRADGTLPARFVHNLQSELGARAEDLTTQTRAGATISTEIRPLLTNVLEETVPGYPEATARYREFSDRIRFLREGTAIGKLEGKKPYDQALAAGKLFNERIRPKDVRNLRQSLRETLPEDEFKETWDAVKTGYLLDAVETTKPLQGGAPLNVPGKMAQALGGGADDAGGLRKRQVTAALFSPKEQKKLNQLAEAFEATSQLYSMNSKTAARLEGAPAVTLPGAATELAAGGVSGLQNMLIRAMPQLAERFMMGGTAAREAYIEAIMKGTKASAQYLDDLNRSLRRAQLRPSADHMDALTRNWGIVLGGAAQSGD